MHPRLDGLNWTSRMRPAPQSAGLTRSSGASTRPERPCCASTVGQASRTPPPRASSIRPATCSIKALSARARRRNAPSSRRGCSRSTHSRSRTRSVSIAAVERIESGSMALGALAPRARTVRRLALRLGAPCHDARILPNRPSGSRPSRSMALNRRAAPRRLTLKTLFIS